MKITIFIIAILTITNSCKKESESKKESGTKPGKSQLTMKNEKQVKIPKPLPKPVITKSVKSKQMKKTPYFTLPIKGAGSFYECVSKKSNETFLFQRAKETTTKITLRHIGKNSVFLIDCNGKDWLKKTNEKKMLKCSVDKVDVVLQILEDYSITITGKSGVNPINPVQYQCCSFPNILPELINEAPLMLSCPIDSKGSFINIAKLPSKPEMAINLHLVNDNKLFNSTHKSYNLKSNSSPFSIDIKMKSKNSTKKLSLKLEQKNQDFILSGKIDKKTLKNTPCHTIKLPIL
jgi:hypothetical protein